MLIYKVCTKQFVARLWAKAIGGEITSKTPKSWGICDR